MLSAWGTDIQEVQTEQQILNITQEPWEDTLVLQSSEDMRDCFP